MAAVTPSDASRVGLSRSGLYRAARQGSYDKLARGIFMRSDHAATDWDWVEAATRRRDATICLESALAHHDLTDAIPSSLDVALPRGARIPVTDSAISWHSFDRATFDIGRQQVCIPGSTQTIAIYSAERSIADSLRLRGAVGYELGRDALKEWLARGGKPAHLIEVAQQLPRARTPVLELLEALS